MHWRAGLSGVLAKPPPRRPSGPGWQRGQLVWATSPRAVHSQLSLCYRIRQVRPVAPWNHRTCHGLLTVCVCVLWPGAAFRQKHYRSYSNSSTAERIVSCVPGRRRIKNRCGALFPAWFSIHCPAPNNLPYSLLGPRSSQLCLWRAWRKRTVCSKTEECQEGLCWTCRCNTRTRAI